MNSVLLRFTGLQRSLHWLMALLITAMLFIGVGMVATVHRRFLALIAVHRPLGICILLLAVWRLAVRVRRGAPSLPADLPRWQAVSARGSQVLLYALMVALPVVGWSMLSAGGYPIVLFGPVHLPPILPHSETLYPVLRGAHTALAYLFFAVIVLHFSAALFHAWVRRDGVFRSMAP
jgi:cytochrome b561